MVLVPCSHVTSTSQKAYIALTRKASLNDRVFYSSER
jgi:hypothetical protein